MSFLQRLCPTCGEHDACHAIECVTAVDIVDEDGTIIHPAGAVVWVSHGPDTTHPECRANPDYPLEGGDSTRPMCEACRTHFGVT